MPSDGIIGAFARKWPGLRVTSEVDWPITPRHDQEIDGRLWVSQLGDDQLGDDQTSGGEVEVKLEESGGGAVLRQGNLHLALHGLKVTDEGQVRGQAWRSVRAFSWVDGAEVGVMLRLSWTG